MDLTSINPYLIVAIAVVGAAIFAWLGAYGRNLLNHDDRYAKRGDYPLDRDLVEAAAFNDLKKEVNDLKKELDLRFKEMSVNSSLSRDKIYNSIRDLEKQNAGQQVALETLITIVNRLDTKFDNLRNASK